MVPSLSGILSDKIRIAEASRKGNTGCLVPTLGAYHRLDDCEHGNGRYVTTHYRIDKYRSYR